MKHIDFLLKPAVYGTHMEAFGVKKEMLDEQKIKLKIRGEPYLGPKRPRFEGSQTWVFFSRTQVQGMAHLGLLNLGFFQ